MEKASSLIEEENLDQNTDGNTSRRVTSEGMNSQTVPRGDAADRERESDVGRSGMSVARSSGAAASENAPRELASGMHPRAVRSIDSGVFSGGPVSAERLVESLQGALSAASRSEAGLSSLHRSVRDASRALTASRHAQESLTEELRVMYRGLNEVMSEKTAVERYAALLTQERDAALDAAEDARREAKREREFLLREQDRFIQLLLEEHEAELQQLRRGLARRPADARGDSGAESQPAPPMLSGDAPEDVAPEDVAPEDVAPDEELAPGGAASAPRAASFGGLSEDDGHMTPRASGAALARLALVNTSSDAAWGLADRPSQLSAEREELPGDERASTYPPPPAILDLDSLAAEVDGNSERPPPIRRLGGEPVLHLKPARVPSQLFDTLASHGGESDTKRKS